MGVDPDLAELVPVRRMQQARATQQYLGSPAAKHYREVRWEQVLGLQRSRGCTSIPCSGVIRVEHNSRPAPLMDEPVIALRSRCRVLRTLAQAWGRSLTAVSIALFRSLWVGCVNDFLHNPATSLFGASASRHPNPAEGLQTLEPRLQLNGQATASVKGHACVVPWVQQMQRGHPAVPQHPGQDQRPTPGVPVALLPHPPSSRSSDEGLGLMRPPRHPLQAETQGARLPPQQFPPSCTPDCSCFLHR